MSRVGVVFARSMVSTTASVAEFRMRTRPLVPRRGAGSNAAVRSVSGQTPLALFAGAKLVAVIAKIRAFVSASTSRARRRNLSTSDTDGREINSCPSGVQRSAQERLEQSAVDGDDLTGGLAEALRH